MGHDYDAEKFLEAFAKTAPSGPLAILDVGCGDSEVPNILAEAGHFVTGIDLFPYGSNHGGNAPSGPCLYYHIQDDFVTTQRMPAGFFDVVVCLSAIEHFGLGAWGTPGHELFYDLKAAQQIGRVLRPGGLLYLSVPIGNAYVENKPHWRVYDKIGWTHLINLTGTTPVEMSYFTSGAIAGHPPGVTLTAEEAWNLPSDPPHSTLLSVTRKGEVFRA